MVRDDHLPLDPAGPGLKVVQALGVSLARGKVVGKSSSNRCRVAGDSGGSISRTGGATCWGHGTGSGAGKGEAQPGSKTAAASIGSDQASGKVLLDLPSNFPCVI